jgi:hypothetical protein
LQVTAAPEAIDEAVAKRADSIVELLDIRAQTLRDSLFRFKGFLQFRDDLILPLYLGVDVTVIFARTIGFLIRTVAVVVRLVVCPRPMPFPVMQSKTNFSGTE